MDSLLNLSAFTSISIVVIGVFFVVLRYLVSKYFPSEPYTQQEDFKIHMIENSFNKNIIASNSALSVGYQQTPRGWGKNGHLQTIYHLVVRRSPDIQFKRVFVEVKSPEGERDPVAVDICSDDAIDAKIDSPTVIVVPGIAGSSKQHYIKNFVHFCKLKGWRSVVLNHRGCHQELKTPSIFCIGDTSDLRLAIEHVHKTYPSSPILAAGFSMGANIIINYAGKYHSHSRGLEPATQHIPLLGVVSVSQGYNLIKTCEFIPSKRPVYDYGLNLKMTSLVKKHRETFSKRENLDISCILKTKSLVDFDKHFTCKIYNISSPEEYYQQQCCSKQLPKIAIPTLMVNALDDPIIPEYQIKPVYEVCKQNSNLIMITTKWGGHLGFAEGTFIPKQETWMDRVAIEYLDTVLKTHLESSRQKASIIVLEED